MPEKCLGAKKSILPSLLQSSNPYWILPLSQGIKTSLVEGRKWRFKVFVFVKTALIKAPYHPLPCISYGIRFQFDFLNLIMY